MRERAEVDTIFARVRQGEHYRVLGVASDAPPEAVQKAWLRLTRWLDNLQHPDRDLGDYRSRVVLATDAVAPVTAEGGREALDTMARAGVGFSSTDDLVGA